MQEDNYKENIKWNAFEFVEVNQTVLQIVMEKLTKEHKLLIYK